MKKNFLKSAKLLTFLVITILFSSCQKDENIEPKKEILLKVESVPFIYGKIYPSFIYSLLGMEKNKKLSFFTATIESNIDTKIELKLEENKFTHESIEIIELKKGTNKINLKLPWKFDNFINIKTSGQIYFRFSLIDKDTKDILGTNNLNMEYRSINECVLQYINPINQQVKYLGGQLFCSYINENEKELDVFLRETLDNKNNDFTKYLNSWSGYQNGEEYTKYQVWTIINELYLRGMAYSDISNSSSSNQNIFGQYVRFPKESLKLNQTNCVDGSVLLASILQKIGIETFLVTRPGHMFMGYYINPKHTKVEYIETTAISTGIYNQIKKKEEDLTNEDLKYDVFEMRKLGIKPIE